MGFEIVGFDEEIDSLGELTDDRVRDDDLIPLTFEGVFTRAFMQPLHGRRDVSRVHG